MSRIFLDMEKLKRPNSGLGQFCVHLGKALYEKDKNIGFYVDESHLNCFGRGNYIQWKRNHKFFGISTEADVWHCLHQEAKYFPKDKNTKLLLTIHDLNFLDKYEGRKKERKLKKLQQLVNKSSGIVYISNYTKSVAQKNLNIPNVPEQVIYNGVSISTDKDEQPKFINNDKPFIFSIGIISEKKNFHVLIEAMNELPELKLYLCGNNNSVYANKIQELISDYKLEERIKLTGEISEEEKNWMYSNCSAFVFPSLSEGFGLPVVEAMHFGKPVVLSQLTSLPEIGGEVAIYLNDFSPKEIAKKVKLAIDSHSIENEKALQNRASLFSWKKAAEQYLEMFQAILRKTNL